MEKKWFNKTKKPAGKKERLGYFAGLPAEEHAYLGRAEGAKEWIIHEINKEISAHALVLDLGSGTANYFNQGRIIYSDALHGTLLQRERTERKIALDMDQISEGHAPFKPESLDAITLNLSINYIENVRKFFQEAKKLIKPGGKIIIIGSPDANAAENRKTHVFNPALYKRLLGKNGFETRIEPKRFMEAISAQHEMLIPIYFYKITATKK